MVGVANVFGYHRQSVATAGYSMANEAMANNVSMKLKLYYLFNPKLKILCININLAREISLSLFSMTAVKQYRSLK